jgi:lipopolysaccharide-induced tumor necrosis factor-alpha factor
MEKKIPSTEKNIPNTMYYPIDSSIDSVSSKKCPQILYCPSCKKEILSNIKFTPGVFAWVACGCCALIGCFWGCCLIPFCIHKTQDVLHFCSVCNNFIVKVTIIG